MAFKSIAYLKMNTVNSLVPWTSQHFGYNMTKITYTRTLSLKEEDLPQFLVYNLIDKSLYLTYKNMYMNMYIEKTF